MKTLTTCLLSLLALTSCASTALAQQTSPCAQREYVVTSLAETYGETQITDALAANGSIVETYANRDTGTWTIAVTRPTGQTCLMATGTDFELLSPAQTPAGDPT